MQAKRDRFARALTEIGFDVLPCQGTYFLNAGFQRFGFRGDDESFCHHMTVKSGVTAIPLSAFYQEGDVRGFVRFCFAKKDEVLDAAASRLRANFSAEPGAAGAAATWIVEEPEAPVQPAPGPALPRLTAGGEQIRRLTRKLPWIKPPRPSAGA